jgi:hypothetical protein
VQEAARSVLLLKLLLAVGELGSHLAQGALLADERLGHLVQQAGRTLLDVLLDPGLGLRIPWSGLRGDLRQVLKQVIDGLLVLLVHLLAVPRRRCVTPWSR